MKKSTKQINVEPKLQPIDFFPKVVAKYAAEEHRTHKTTVVVESDRKLKLKGPKIQGTLSIDAKGWVRFIPVASVGSVSLAKSFVVARPKAVALLQKLLNQKPLS